MSQHRTPETAVGFGVEDAHGEEVRLAVIQVVGLDLGGERLFPELVV